MEHYKEHSKKSPVDWIGVIERIALVIVFAFALYLVGTNSDWIMDKYRYLELAMRGDANDLGYDVVHGELGGQVVRMLVADTPEKWRKGLSAREIIGAKQGMLFVFDRPDRHGIWMKDMLFSIDIIWFNENFEAIKIQTNVSPDTYPQVFEPDTQALYVLETRAGFVDRHNIELGDKLDIYD